MGNKAGCFCKDRITPLLLGEEKGLGDELDLRPPYISSFGITPNRSLYNLEK